MTGLPDFNRQDSASSERENLHSRLLTVREAAALLNVSSSLIYHLIDSRKLACHRIGARRGTIRIREEDLDEYLFACRSDRIDETPRASVPRLRHIKL